LFCAWEGFCTSVVGEAGPDLVSLCHWEMLPKDNTKVLQETGILQMGMQKNTAVAVTV